MNDPTVNYSVGTVLPNLVVALQTEQGTAINLTTASTVNLQLVDPRSGTESIKSATIVTANDGIVSVEVSSDLTTEPREWLGRYRITFASGRTVDVPNAGHLRLSVT